MFELDCASDQLAWQRRCVQAAISQAEIGQIAISREKPAERGAGALLDAAVGEARLRCARLGGVGGVGGVGGSAHPEV